jgi:DNA-binding IclR family transcriptional regulator
MKSADAEKRLLSSLLNALNILKSFTVESPLKGITDLSRELGLGKSTVHRLVTTLANEGFLVKDRDTQKYRLGYAVLSLSGVMTYTLDLYNESLPIVQNLVDKVNETAHVCILHGHEVLYLLKVECMQPVRFLTYAGKRNPLHSTSSGKVLLAHQDQAFIDDYMKKHLKKYTEYTITDPVQLSEVLSAVRKNGYVVTREEMVEGVHSIAAPVYDYTGKVVAAVTVLGPKQRFNASRIEYLIPHVIETAWEISEQMGYQRRNEGSAAGEQICPPC